MFNSDIYTTTTTNLLLEVPVPEQSGYSTSLQNLGRVRNWGVEIQIKNGKDIKWGKFIWNTSLNISTNKNKVLELAPGQTQILSGTNSYARTKVGGSISELYGYEVTGVYKSQDQIANSPHMSGTVVGDYIIKDLNGDGVIDTKDKKGFGTPNPNVIIGLNNSIKYKDFELSVDLYSELGKKIYSRSLANLISSGEGFTVASKDYFDNRYHPINNSNGKYATPNMGNFSNARKEARVSNMYFDNASYLRLRTLKFGYNLPSLILRPIGLKKCQLYLLGNNILTFTPYKGFSVDSNSNSILAQGYDNANYPTARSFTIGVNINF